MSDELSWPPGFRWEADIYAPSSSQDDPVIHEHLVPQPVHIHLGLLIERLEMMPDMTQVCSIGFKNPHSYRGYYEDLAFEVAHDVTVGEMLAAAKSALGTTYQGWKGGDYEMKDYTQVWLVRGQGHTGETLGQVLLEFMLASTFEEADE